MITDEFKADINALFDSVLTDDGKNPSLDLLNQVRKHGHFTPAVAFYMLVRAESISFVFNCIAIMAQNRGINNAELGAYLYKVMGEKTKTAILTDISK